MPPRSDAVALICRMSGALILLFGLYVALHATVTPGGGFQGGVIVASGTLLIFLGEGYRGWRRLIRSRVLDSCEGGGAVLYALCGFASMAAGSPFLHNILPLGTLRDVFSGGLMQLENAGVFFAVGGGFTVLFLEFLEETRAEQAGDEP
ncbi:MAG: MnhB domain-containing protein [Pseudomonadota bacterium]|nr:MnhB domain-containing protein [Pseudomonadota bacterium]